MRLAKRFAVVLIVVMTAACSYLSPTPTTARFRARQHPGRYRAPRAEITALV